MLKVNEARLLRHIEELGQIGFRPGSGTSRLSFTEAYEKGRAYVKELMEEAGLFTSVDPVGNLTGFLPGRKPGARIAVGSHLDTVPDGGMYDGAYGVLAAVECVQTMCEAGEEPRYPIEVVGFVDEEGTAVSGTFGSRCFIGDVFDEDAGEKMRRFGFSEEDTEASRRRPEDYRCFLELHIEQGGILDQRGAEVGIVNGIVGILRFETCVMGSANHAGTTPMELRNDALEKACLMICDLLKTVREKEPEMVCTVGTMQVSPGAYNVIPGKVRFTIDLRYREMEPMYRVINAFAEKYKDRGLRIKETLNQPPTLCDQGLLDLAREGADQLGISRMELFSGAGHDLINMQLFTPSALLFIPSRGGVSHKKEEYSSPKNMADGANVLLHTILKLEGGQNENID